jgi:YidC/Oxa1 family membrane protein insertase
LDPRWEGTVLGFLGDVGSVVMTPLYYVVSAFLLAWREIFGLLVPDDDGWTWALAIVGMAATIRVLMMPFYLRQMRARHDLRKLEPEIRALQETYGHDRERLAQEQMRLLRAAGMKPLLSLLPLIVLGALLLALYRIIDASAKFAPGDGPFRRGFVTGTDAQSLAHAKILGARIADTFLDSSHVETQVVAIVLVVVVCVMHVVAQRQEAAQFSPADALWRPIEQQQTFLLPALLVGIVAVSLVLPLGVLIFWATSKVCTVGQQRILRGCPGSG